jgi:hypothetical protein
VAWGCRPGTDRQIGDAVDKWIVFAGALQDALRWEWARVSDIVDKIEPDELHTVSLNGDVQLDVRGDDLAALIGGSMPVRPFMGGPFA